MRPSHCWTRHDVALASDAGIWMVSYAFRELAEAGRMPEECKRSVRIRVQS